MNSPSENFTQFIEVLRPQGVDGDDDRQEWRSMSVPTEEPVMHQEELKAAPVVAPTPPPCIPVLVFAILRDPIKDIYDLADVVTFTGDAVSGTLPITYEWYINGVMVSTDEAFEYTVADGDIEGKDETGLGHIDVKLIVKNACNEGGSEQSGSILAQGTP